MLRLLFAFTYTGLLSLSLFFFSPSSLNTCPVPFGVGGDFTRRLICLGYLRCLHIDA
jgi:hypothetical protein